MHKMNFLKNDSPLIPDQSFSHRMVHQLEPIYRLSCWDGHPEKWYGKLIKCKFSIFSENYLQKSVSGVVIR